MSYSLMAIDVAQTPSLDELISAIEQAETDKTVSAPTERLASFFADVMAKFPSLETDEENSPWSVTPTLSADLGGKALGFSVAKMDLLFDVLM